MKLCAFEADGSVRLGLVEQDQVADLHAAAPGLPATLSALLEAGAAGLDAVRHAAERAPRRPLDSVRLKAPLPHPRNFFCVGLNYAAHAREMGRDIPDFPACFSKASSVVVGPGEAIVRPAGFTTLDYEGELGVVIGRRCKNVAAEDAAQVIAGYMVINDVSVREMLAADRLVLAKGCDTFGPTGPWLTTADEIDLAAGLRIRTWVDGELRQDSSTSDMIFPVPRLIEVFSRGITLHPGDIITTGSPPGSGNGFKPPRYLEPGQIVEVEIEGLGRIANPVHDYNAKDDIQGEQP